MVNLFENSAILPNSEIFFIAKNDSKRFSFGQSKWLKSGPVFEKLFSLKSTWSKAVSSFSSNKRFVFAYLVYRTAINQPLIVEKFLPNSLNDGNEYTIISRRRNLGGIELRASMVVTNNDSLNHLTDYRDKHIDTITKVCFILTNHLISYLNASVTYSTVSSWGYLDGDGDWSGMIGQLVRNEADLGATSLFFTVDRVSVIQYIAMPSSTGSAFIFRSPKLSYTDNVFLLPFDDFVWMCLVCLVVITAGCLLITVFVEYKLQVDGPSVSLRHDTLKLFEKKT